MPVLTVTIGRTLFMATMHNQYFKLRYMLRSTHHPGDFAFPNSWNMYNCMGRVIPLTNGYAMKHETPCVGFGTSLPGSAATSPSHSPVSSVSGFETLKVVNCGEHRYQNQIPSPGVLS